MASPLRVRQLIGKTEVAPFTLFTVLPFYACFLELGRLHLETQSRTVSQMETMWGNGFYELEANHFF